MTRSMLARHARIVRVRSAQHMLAASAAASADQQVVSLETNSTKLGSLRDSLTVQTGTTNGATLQNRGELAQRLDRARDGLNQAIVNARKAAEERTAERIDARQKQESAAKLDARALHAFADWTEARLTAAFRPRTNKIEDKERG